MTGLLTDYVALLAVILTTGLILTMTLVNKGWLNE